MKKLILTLLVASVAMQAQFSRRAPGFSLPDITGKQFDLADYRGKIVLLDIIQTTCPRCIELTKSLDQVKAKYGDRVQVLTVVTLPDTLPKVQAFASQYKVTNPILLDCGQMIGSYLNVTPKNPAVHFPHLIVIDKNGLIRRDLAEDATTLPNILGAIEAAAK